MRLSVMSTRTRLLLKSALTITLLSFILWSVDLKVLLSSLASADLRYVLLAALIQAFTVAISSARWKIIIENFSMHIPWRVLVRLSFIGFFFGLFLPSGIGGDFFRAFYLSKKAKRGMSTTLMTTLLERSGGLCALLLIGCGATLILRPRLEGVPALLIFGTLGVAYILITLAMFHSKSHRFVGRLLMRWRSGDLEQKIELVSKGLETLRKNPKAVAGALGVSLAIQFLSVVVVWSAAHALNLTAPFSAFLVFVPLISLSIMMPLTINGIGLREWLYALLFRQIGVPVEAAVSLSLLHFGVFLIAAIPGGIFYSLHKKEQEFEDFSNLPPDALESDSQGR